jgi:hypothetical protein
MYQYIVPRARVGCPVYYTVDSRGAHLLRWADWCTVSPMLSRRVVYCSELGRNQMEMRVNYMQAGGQRSLSPRELVSWLE